MYAPFLAHFVALVLACNVSVPEGNSASLITSKGFTVHLACKKPTSACTRRFGGYARQKTLPARTRSFLRCSRASSAMPAIRSVMNTCRSPRKPRNCEKGQRSAVATGSFPPELEVAFELFSSSAQAGCRFRPNQHCNSVVKVDSPYDEPELLAHKLPHAFGRYHADRRFNLIAHTTWSACRENKVERIL